MTLWHTTLVSNLPSIYKTGILTSKSKGKMKVVWLHEKKQQGWAFLHVIKRHGGRVEEVCSLLVDVTLDDIRRSSSPGLFYHLSDIPPDHIRTIETFTTVARSPLEGKRHARTA